MLIWSLTIIQALLGAIILIGTLRQETAKLFKHRFILFIFASVGSVTFTSAFVLFGKLGYRDSLMLSIISLFCILILVSTRWDVKQLCDKIEEKFKHEN